MQRRLTAAGMRPISNIVDASNYVMLELNQPTHAYDLDTLGGGGFRIRAAREGETMVTLDGNERTLGPADILICDAHDTPIGVGGVMGGLDTEITDATTTVAFEAAWFTPLPIMQTAQRLGLRSEASARFERGVDPYITHTAVARFVELLRETCPDLVVHPATVDATGPGLPPQHRSVTVRISEVNRILGTALVADDLPPLLDPIGYTVTGSGDERSVALPSWRPDSEAEVDVIEEVARHYGYDRIGKTVPGPRCTAACRGCSSAAAGCARCCSVWASPKRCRTRSSPPTTCAAGIDGPTIRITNPLVDEESVLRTSLRPGLLRAIAFNESHRRSNARLFEIGHVYPPGSGDLPDEHEVLCVVLAGEEAPAAMAVWRELAAALGVGARIDQGRVPGGLHATRSATLQAGKDPMGAVGEIDPAVLRRFDVTERVAIVELRSTRCSPDPKTPAAGSRSAATRRAISTSRSSSPTTSPPRRWRRRCGRGRQLAGRPRAVRRVSRAGRRRRPPQPGLSPAPPGARPQPHRHRHRRGPPCRGHGGGELGAELRG